MKPGILSRLFLSVVFVLLAAQLWAESFPWPERMIWGDNHYQVFFPPGGKPTFFPEHSMIYPENQAKGTVPLTSAFRRMNPQKFLASDSFVTVYGPYGGVVRSIARDFSSQWLYIATDGEVYRSKDNGAHWEMNLFPSQFHNAVEPVTVLGPGIIAAETDYQTFISRDGGDHWEFMVENLRGFALDTNGVIYAGSNFGAKISTDTAKTWRTFALEGQKIWSVVLCEAGKMACPSDSGIYYSQDHGITWTFRPYDTPYTWNLVSDKKGHLFVLKYYGNAFQLFRSSDFGVSWQQITLPVGGEPYRIYIETNGRVVVPVGKHILLSMDAGNTWRDIPFGALTVGRDFKANLLAGTFEGIFRYDSLDGKWENISTGIHARRIETIAFTPSGGMLVLSYRKCFRSDDLGNSWKQVEFPWAVNFNPYSPILVTSQGSIFIPAIFDNYTKHELIRSRDEGKTWERIARFPKLVTALAEGDSGTILAVCYPGDIYRSLDDGATWARVYSAPEEKEIKALTANRAGYYYASADSMILTSRDGRIWEEDSLPRRESYYEQLCVDARGDVYLGTLRDGVFHSTDQGKSWKKMNDGLGNLFVLAMDTDVRGNVVLGSGSGVYRLMDRENRWERLGKGLPETFFVSIAISPDGYIFAGTQDFGMYRSVDTLTKRFPPPPPPPPEPEIDRFVLYPNYPNPFNERTLIRYDVPVLSKVTVRIVNIRGQIVKTLVSGIMEKGNYSTEWVPANLSSGIYFCEMIAWGCAKRYHKAVKMIYLK